MAIGHAIGIPFKIRTSVSSPQWTDAEYILTSGATWYKREINNAEGWFKLWYSSNAGATWSEIHYLDLTEASILIDLAHAYRHRIVDGEYRVDQTLTPTGYDGIEGTDWENIGTY